MIIGKGILEFWFTVRNNIRLLTTILGKLVKIEKLIWINIFLSRRDSSIFELCLYSPRAIHCDSSLYRSTRSSRYNIFLCYSWYSICIHGVDNRLCWNATNTHRKIVYCNWIDLDHINFCFFRWGFTHRIIFIFVLSELDYCWLSFSHQWPYTTQTTIHKDWCSILGRYSVYLDCSH